MAGACGLKLRLIPFHHTFISCSQISSEGLTFKLWRAVAFTVPSRQTGGENNSRRGRANHNAPAGRSGRLWKVSAHFTHQVSSGDSNRRVARESVRYRTLRQADINTPELSEMARKKKKNSPQSEERQPFPPPQNTKAAQNPPECVSLALEHYFLLPEWSILLHPPSTQTETWSNHRQRRPVCAAE